MGLLKNISLVQLLCIGIVIVAITFIGIFTFNQREKEPELMQEIQTNTNTVNILNGQWSYMPGATKSNNGLIIRPTNISIIKQNGSFAENNPPINIAGTYLSNLKRDFEIIAMINPLNSTSASIQLYGQVPIIADEFKVERESIRLTIEKNHLKISVWNRSKQTPAEEKVFDFTPQQINKITLTYKDSTILFNVNDIHTGTINTSKMFKFGKVWFGLDAQGGDWLLAELYAKRLNESSFETIDASTIQIAKNDLNGLQTQATNQRSDFLVGSAMALGPIVSDEEYAKVALDKNMFGSMTPENQMKMINLQPQQNMYTFEHANALVKIAKQNGLKIHGHTLVFGEANPSWFNNLPVKTVEDKQKIAVIMQEHITTVMKYFGDDITSWDVVNEPLADYYFFDRGNGKIFRTHKWYQAMGKDYIINALEIAYKANPNALLFINEYGLEQDGERWDTFITFLSQLKPQLEEKKIPLDKIGIGFQAHVYESDDRIDPEILRKHIQQLERLGYKMQISEMDVYSRDGEKVQAKQYADVFKTCLSENNCIAWRGWILSDRYNLWKDKKGQIKNGKDGLFNNKMQPVQAFKQMQLISKF